MKVAPSGLPTLRSWLRAGWLGSTFPIDVLRRKSWVMAMPIEANDNEVRSHARKVRSEASNENCMIRWLDTYLKQGGLAQRCPYFPTRYCYISQIACSTTAVLLCHSFLLVCLCSRPHSASFSRTLTHRILLSLAIYATPTRKTELTNRPA